MSIKPCLLNQRMGYIGPEVKFASLGCKSPSVESFVMF
jgi:hypothetical protein